MLVRKDITKEELSKLELAPFHEEIPLLDGILISPLSVYHESGHRCMLIVGFNQELNYMKKIDVICDVITIGDYFKKNSGETINIDLFDNGIFHIFSFDSRKKFKVLYRLSTFSFVIVDGEKE